MPKLSCKNDDFHTSLCVADPVVATVVTRHYKKPSVARSRVATSTSNAVPTLKYNKSFICSIINIFNFNLVNHWRTIWDKKKNKIFINKCSSKLMEFYRLSFISARLALTHQIIHLYRNTIINESKRWRLIIDVLAIQTYSKICSTWGQVDISYLSVCQIYFQMLWNRLSCINIKRNSGLL